MIIDNKLTITNYQIKSTNFTKKKIIKEKKEKIKKHMILKQLSLKIQLQKNIQVYQNLGNKNNNLWANKLIQGFLRKLKTQNKILF